MQAPNISLRHSQNLCQNILATLYVALTWSLTCPPSWSGRRPWDPWPGGPPKKVRLKPKEPWPFQRTVYLDILGARNPPLKVAVVQPFGNSRWHKFPCFHEVFVRNNHHINLARLTVLTTRGSAFLQWRVPFLACEEGQSKKPPNLQYIILN